MPWKLSYTTLECNIMSYVFGNFDSEVDNRREGEFKLLNNK